MLASVLPVVTLHTYVCSPRDTTNVMSLGDPREGIQVWESSLYIKIKFPNPLRDDALKQSRSNVRGASRCKLGLFTKNIA